MKKINIKAIIAGIAVCAVGSTLSAIAVAIIIPGEIEDLFSSNTFLIPALLMGIFLTITGGYITSRIAKANEYLNSGLLGIVGVLISLLSISDLPVWVNIVEIGSSIPCALLGAYLARLKGYKS